MDRYSIRQTCAPVVAMLAVIAGAPAAHGLEQGDVLVRARAVFVSPNDDSGLVSAAGTPVAGSGVSVDNGVTLDIDFTYMFTDHIGAELLLDLTSKHDISSSGTLSTIVPGKIIESYVLPPTLLLQYHFLPDSKVRPYVGAGINYTMFLGEKATNNAKSVAGLSRVKLDSSFGWAAQVGADFDMGDDWFFNLDVKYIDMNTTATASSALGDLRVDVDVDPWLFGIGIGKRF